MSRAGGVAARGCGGGRSTGRPSTQLRTRTLPSGTGPAGCAPRCRRETGPSPGPTQGLRFARRRRGVLGQPGKPVLTARVPPHPPYPRQGLLAWGSWRRVCRAGAVGAGLGPAADPSAPHPCKSGSPLRQRRLIDLKARSPNTILGSMCPPSSPAPWLGSLYCPLVSGRGTVPSPQGSRHGRPLSVPGWTVPVGPRSPRLDDSPRLPMGGPRAWSRSPVKLDGRGVPMNSAPILVTVPSNTPVRVGRPKSRPQLSPVQPVAGSLDRLGSRQTWTRAGERTSSRVRPLQVPPQRHPQCVLGVAPGMAACSFSGRRCRVERLSVSLYRRLAPVTWRPPATCLLAPLTCRHFQLLHSNSPALEPGRSASPRHAHTHMHTHTPLPTSCFWPHELCWGGGARHGFLVVQGIRSLAHSVPWALPGACPGVPRSRQSPRPPVGKLSGHGEPQEPRGRNSRTAEGRPAAPGRLGRWLPLHSRGLEAAHIVAPLLSGPPEFPSHRHADWARLPLPSRQSGLTQRRGRIFWREAVLASESNPIPTAQLRYFKNIFV
uniref:Uncharacterized protein n=1 Tax=Myotis myotis TaxID=51298 RepID=A0A7J7ZWK0_MYOMY|nr:hypothetical protein mMyoMyo1_009565 [Myotis myotis]